MGGTAGEMGSALNQVVALLLNLAKVCALNMVHKASAVSATAAPTHKGKVAFVRGTADEMGS